MRDSISRFSSARLAVELEQRLRVDADVAVDDELEAREAHAFVGQPLELERELRIADVHHDLGRRRRHAVERDVDDVDRQESGVDVAGVAFRARHGDLRAVGEHARRVAAPDDRRDAQLARDDGRVARAAAAVGDDRGGALHHRFPVRVGHLGDQHVARPDARHLRCGPDEADAALPDLLADRAARREHLGAARQPIPAQPVGAFLLRLHGLRTRLQDVELPVAAVAAPLDVHRAAVVALDRDGHPAQRLGLGVGDGEANAFGRRHFDGHRRLAGRARVRENHPLRLAADGLAQDRRPARREVALVDVELVRIDRPLHNGFAQAVGGRDEHDLVEARFRIEREHDARGAGVAAHHPLDAGRQRDLGFREALVHAIGNGPVVVERREHFAYCLNNVIYSIDIKKCFLLPCERRIGQVLGGGGRPDREREVAARLRQRGIGAADLLLQRRGQRRFGQPPADLRPRRRQRRDVVDVECGEPRRDPVREVLVAQELAERERRGREAAGNADARAGELADHLAQRSILATDLRQVGHAQPVERDHPRAVVRHGRGQGWEELTRRGNPHRSGSILPPGAKGAGAVAGQIMRCGKQSKTAASRGRRWCFSEAPDPQSRGGTSGWVVVTSS